MVNNTAFDNHEGFRKYRKIVDVEAVQMSYDFVVDSLEGLMQGYAGDYLCRGIDGEYWAVRREIFERTYVPVGVWPSESETNSGSFDTPITIHFK